MMFAGLGRGQREPDAGPGSGCALHADLTLVCAHGLPRDEQAEAGPAHVRAGQAEELLEDPRLELARDALARVGHAQRDVAAWPLDGDQANDAATRRVANRIGDEVHEDEMDALAVGGDARQTR